MKFMVVVNQKYLVSVEANTHGGAEHKILDNIYCGIETCLAFTIEETATDIFKTLVENCETISYTEMLEKSKVYKETLNNLEHAKRVAEKEQAQIKDLYDQIELRRDELRILANNIDTYNQELKEIW